MEFSPGPAGLRIWHCHCSSSGHCCGVGSIPGLGTSTCCGHSQKQTSRAPCHLQFRDIQTLCPWVFSLIFKSRVPSPTLPATLVPSSTEVPTNPYRPLGFKYGALAYARPPPVPASFLHSFIHSSICKCSQGSTELYWERHPNVDLGNVQERLLGGSGGSAEH